MTATAGDGVRARDRAVRHRACDLGDVAAPDCSLPSSAPVAGAG
ncbi:hypothetical protein [Marinitenerispora sediminis]|nr:hypothetical protein [Marinitenerispora sediminis]